jgi:hypothetical protein
MVGLVVASRERASAIRASSSRIRSRAASRCAAERAASSGLWQSTQRRSGRSQADLFDPEVVADLPVAALAGEHHAQMRTTTDTYSHVMPALGRDAAERMGNALWD